MTTLKVGDKAPIFSGINQNGDQIALTDLKGKKIVLFFYPKASTPGCTTEACNLRDNYELFLTKGYEVIGVSADSQKRQFNFAKKNELLKKFMGREYEGIYRTTFVINEKGIIENIIEKVKTKEHHQQILD